MKIKRIAFGALILSMLACNFVTQMIAPPTATPQPTPTASQTPTLTPSPTPTPIPLVPAYIPPQCADKPLATVPPDGALEQPTLEAVANPRISKSEQLQIFAKMTGIIEDVYVYPDYNGKDWQAIKEEYRSKIEAGLDTEAFYQEMRSMIQELGDEHSDYLSPAEVKASDAELQGEVQYVGIGILGDYKPEKQSIVLLATIPGSAAEYGGLQSHDSILLVDGLPIEEGYSRRIRGVECSVVILKVQSPDEAPREVMLMRYLVEGGPPVEARLVATTDSSRIGYIFLPSFFDETLLQQMEEALNQFGELDGLILDLRLNGGGINTVAYPIMSYFTSGNLGKFVSREESRSLEIQPNPIQNSQTVPLIIMVSEDTVSYGEIFAGVMQDSGRAKVVGETSLGNVEVLHGYDFDDDSVMWIAYERFVSAFSDVNWEQTGIVPDVQAFANWGTFYFDTDPSIAAALGLLGHK